ncbi:MAG: hypothetical protein KF757_05685 [Phycisphaeraceae bacterium]|nr:hypothetical protein [Phycisphaeraceae bacterium]MCW5763663.1 hypothetical protein [Phycisphaeraceae bacterium]
MLSKSCVLLACLNVAVATGFSKSESQNSSFYDSSWHELKEASTTWGKSSGTIVATFEFSGETKNGMQGYGRMIIAYDAVTGAWFQASQQDVMGRDRMGRSFRGEARRGSIVIDEQPVDDSGLSLSYYIPSIYTQWLLQESSRASRIERAIDQTWRVSFQRPFYGTSRTRAASIILSADGSPQRLEVAADPEMGHPVGDTISYTIDQRSPPGFAVVEKTGGANPFRLVQIDYFPDGKTELFEVENIESMAVDNRILGEMRVTAISGEAMRGREPASIVYEQQRVSRMSWPLIVTGIVVVVIGLFVLIRARVAR